MNIRSLSQAQRVLLLGRERIKYQTKYPDSKVGTFNHSLHDYESRPVRFTRYAATKYEISKRTIDGCLAVYSALGEDVIKSVIGTTCDTFTFLERLKLIPLEDRPAYIKARARRIAAPNIRGL
jgi:hypothetical protein